MWDSSATVCAMVRESRCGLTSLFMRDIGWTIELTDEADSSTPTVTSMRASGRMIRRMAAVFIQELMAPAILGSGLKIYSTDTVFKSGTTALPTKENTSKATNRALANSHGQTALFTKAISKKT